MTAGPAATSGTRVVPVAGIDTPRRSRSCCVARYHGAGSERDNLHRNIFWLFGPIVIETVTAVQFDRRSTSGRTGPGFLLCEDDSGDDVELVAKLSATCDLSVTSLSMEAICACLAGDLGLPIPQPFFVRMDADWIDSIADTDWRAAAQRSCPVAFGSKRLPPGYAQWISSTSLTGAMPDIAAAVLLFDALIDNPDRRSNNPNCLVRGEEIRIFDHELALPTAVLFGWRPPWMVGGLQNLEQPGAHIFREPLKRKVVNWDAIKAQWTALSDERLQEYVNVLPPEWGAAITAAQSGLIKVRNARDNIDGCIAEVQRLIG